MQGTAHNIIIVLTETESETKSPVQHPYRTYDQRDLLLLRQRS